MMDMHLAQVLADLLADHGCGFMCGGFGATAEFMRDGNEAVRIGPDLQAVTGRGGVRIAPTADLVPLAYEMPGRRTGWTQTLELCLPTDRASGAARSQVTELGPDADALRPEDRGAVLFDLGLGFPHAEFCVRASDPETLDALRGGCGTPLLAGNPAVPAIMRRSPHRVARTALGRVEVFQPIPPPNGRSPEGPHTHLLPKLLAHGRTHAANLPVPIGLIPCLSVFPGSPLTKGGFDRRRWAAFQDLLARYAEQGWLTAKRAAQNGDLQTPTRETRSAAMARRVAARQAPHLQG